MIITTFEKKKKLMKYKCFKTHKALYSNYIMVVYFFGEVYNYEDKRIKITRNQ